MAKPVLVWAPQQRGVGQALLWQQLNHGKNRVSCVLSLVYEFVLGFEADLLGGEASAHSSHILVL